MFGERSGLDETGLDLRSLLVIALQVQRLDLSGEGSPPLELPIRKGRVLGLGRVKVTMAPVAEVTPCHSRDPWNLLEHVLPMAVMS